MPKIKSISGTGYTAKNISFSGMAVKMPKCRINAFADAIEQYKLLKNPKYTDIFQETETASVEEIMQNKKIRLENFSFLNSITQKIDKIGFINYFKEFTGFPVLKNSTSKILQEFENAAQKASNSVRYIGKESDAGKILMMGYDPFCSVGLKKAVPGSDIDKGFIIIKGGHPYYSEKDYADAFKNALWKNIDNRLMSVNHPAAFPNVYTDIQITSILNKLDNYSQPLVQDTGAQMYFIQKRLNDVNPVTGARFNIFLSDQIPEIEEKITAKNFGYFIETVRDGSVLKMDNEYAMRKLQPQMNSSPFAWFSNIAQIKAMENRLNSMELSIKPKLKAREHVEQTFEQWDSDSQYEYIKDLIKGISGDSMDSKFASSFYSIDDRHRLLINDILTDKVEVFFENIVKDNELIGERAHLSLSPQTAMKYGDLNIFNYKL